MYVDDYGNDRIQKFQNSGESIKTWGTSGNGAVEFQEPEGVATDSKGNVYVADKIIIVSKNLTITEIS